MKKIIVLALMSLNFALANTIDHCIDYAFDELKKYTNDNIGHLQGSNFTRTTWQCILSTAN